MLTMNIPIYKLNTLPDGRQMRHVLISSSSNPTHAGSIKVSFTTEEGDDEYTVLKKATTALNQRFSITKTWAKDDKGIWSGECVPL